MYYLLGCFSDPAAEAVKVLLLTSNHYDLALQFLNERFNKSQLVATALLEKLLCIAPIQHESLFKLSNFGSVIDEIILYLMSLDIPDLDSFILFSLASRSLPVGIRKLFEVENSDNF